MGVSVDDVRETPVNTLYLEVILFLTLPAVCLHWEKKRAGQFSLKKKERMRAALYRPTKKILLREIEWPVAASSSLRQGTARPDRPNGWGRFWMSGG